MAAETDPGRIPTAFRDQFTNSLREIEQPELTGQFDGGGNEAGSCSPGIGIDIDGGARLEDPSTWTLLDQGDALDNPMVPAPRTPQVGQYLGGSGYVLFDNTSTENGTGVEGKGTVGINVYLREERPADPVEGNTAPNSVDGQAQFPDLATGWESDGTP